MKGSFRSDGVLLTGYCALIFFLSHQPALPVPMLFPHQDKLHHFTAYAVMGLLAFRAVRHQFRGTNLWVVSILFCSLYGVSDEYHQSFVAGRMAEVADWIADTAGAVFSIAVLYRFKTDWRV